MIPKAILGLSAILFLVVGVVFIAAPNWLLPSVNVTAPEGTASTDVRAVYGGLDLGVGIALAYCLARRHVRVGLVLAAVTLGGLAFGRAVGVVLDANQTSITYILWATEIGGALFAAAGLMLHQKVDQPR